MKGDRRDSGAERAGHRPVSDHARVLERRHLDEDRPRGLEQRQRQRGAAAFTEAHPEVEERLQPEPARTSA